MSGGDGNRRRITLAACAVALGGALAKGLGAVGTTLRLVDWMVIFAGGIAAGVFGSAATASFRRAEKGGRRVPFDPSDR